MLDDNHSGAADYHFLLLTWKTLQKTEEEARLELRARHLEELREEAAREEMEWEQINWGTSMEDLLEAAVLYGYDPDASTGWERDFGSDSD